MSYNHVMRNFDRSLIIDRLLRTGVVSALGCLSLLAAGCSESSSGSRQVVAECVSNPIYSPWYSGSNEYRGLLVTVPNVSNNANLIVGFETPNGQWQDSGDVADSVTPNGRETLVLGIKHGAVRFRFQAVFLQNASAFPDLGKIQFSAQNTAETLPWSEAIKSDNGNVIQPQWPPHPIVIPKC